MAGKALVAYGVKLVAAWVVVDIMAVGHCGCRCEAWVAPVAGAMAGIAHGAGTAFM